MPTQREIAATKKTIKAMGLLVVWDSDWEEFIINLPGHKKGEGTHCSDCESAIADANALATWRDCRASKAA